MTYSRLKDKRSDIKVSYIRHGSIPLALSNFSNFSWGFDPPGTKLNTSLSYHSSASSTTLEDDIENQDEHDLVEDFSVSSVERSARCVSVVNVVRRSEFKVRDSPFTVGAFTAARSHIAAHFPENSFASLINRPPPRAREAIKPDSVSLGWWE